MAERERAFLGMTHNPFIKPDQGFFDRGDRKTHLEQLRHLSQWSRRVLLVTGPEGVGKTALYRQLSASLEPQVKAARVNGALINTSREVVLAVAQGFGLAAPHDANAQLLKSLIEDHVSEQEKGGRQCVALVDDAQLLEPRAIDELISMADRSGLRMVLFGEVRVVTGVERAADRAGVGWHEIRLSGYGEADCREYLEWRFRQARYRGRIPFTDQQVREIVRLSDGLPGRINQMANVLMAKLETGGFAKTRIRLPRLHVSVLVLLVVLTVLTWLLFRGEDEAGDPVLEVVELPVPISDDVAATREATLAQTTAPENDVPSVADTDAAVTRPKPETAAPAVTAAVTADNAPAAAAAVTSENAPTAAVAVAQTNPPEKVVDKPVPGPAVKPAETGRRDGRWLLAQPSSAFTVQLVTLSSSERAAAFVAEQKNPEQYATYQLARDGRVLHVVVYGIFDSKTEAERAARALTGSAAKVQPWIRSLTQVHAAIRTVLRQ